MKRTLSLFALLLVSAVLASTPDEARIHKRLEAIRSSDTEAWREIPWTATLLDAARAARKEGKPIFVFSHEGNIDSGRC